jgi:hypothetical protein
MQEFFSLMLEGLHLFSRYQGESSRGIRGLEGVGDNDQGSMSFILLQGRTQSVSRGRHNSLSWDGHEGCLCNTELVGTTICIYPQDELGGDVVAKSTSRVAMRLVCHVLPPPSM